jgi:hypothetical protein
MKKRITTVNTGTVVSILALLASIAGVIAGLHGHHSRLLYGSMIATPFCVAFCVYSWSHRPEQQSTEEENTSQDSEQASTDEWAEFWLLQYEAEEADGEQRKALLNQAADFLKKKLACLGAEDDDLQVSYILEWASCLVGLRRVLYSGDSARILTSAQNEYSNVLSADSGIDAELAKMMYDKLEFLFDEFGISTSFANYVEVSTLFIHVYEESFDEDYPELQKFIVLVDTLAKKDIRQSIKNDFEELRENPDQFDAVLTIAHMLTNAALETDYAMLAFEIQQWAHGYYNREIDKLSDLTERDEIKALLLKMYGAPAEVATE